MLLALIVVRCCYPGMTFHVLYKHIVAFRICPLCHMTITHFASMIPLATFSPSLHILQHTLQSLLLLHIPAFKVRRHDAIVLGVAVASHGLLDLSFVRRDRCPQNFDASSDRLLERLLLCLGRCDGVLDESNRLRTGLRPVV